MKRLVVFFISLLFLLTIGCLNGGDGDGDSGTVPPSAPGHVPGQTVTLAQGSANVSTGSWIKIDTFNVGTSGILTATITWGSGPATLSSNLWHPATWAYGSAMNETSPMSVSKEVTDTLKDAGEEWELYVLNSAGPDVTVDYTVTFTAN